MKGRILLVEDDQALVELIRYHLEREEFEVSHTANGEEALLLAQESPPDLVLLDWMIEGVSGIEVCRRLRRLPATANVPIIMLTARGEEADRVRPALAGEQLAYADVEMDLVGHKVRRGGEPVQLGPTEFRLLRHFLEHPGRVFSRERLLDSVWGHDSDIELRTVDVHIRRLRLAIGEPDLIRTVRSAGYALDAEGLA